MTDFEFFHGPVTKSKPVTRADVLNSRHRMASERAAQFARRGDKSRAHTWMRAAQDALDELSRLPA